MDPKHEIAIDQLAADMDCPKDFQCRKTNFQNLCDARISMGGTLVDCSHAQCSLDNNGGCPFRVNYGRGLFCTCPIRIYVARVWDSRPYADQQSSHEN